MSFPWLERISSDPKFCHSKVYTEGPRVMIPVILDNLTEDATFEENLAEYPTVLYEDIQASIQSAYYLATEKIFNY